MRSITAILLLTISMSGMARAGEAAADSTLLIERERLEMPSYEQALEQTDVERYADRDDYDSARADTRFVLEKLWYRSGGLRVAAYAMHAAGDGGPRPTIVFNRGSYVRGEIAPELLVLFHRLATAGFSVLAPMYRGSAGGEGVDELGGADLTDLMNIVPLASELPFVDPSKLLLLGESRGGMMVFQAIRDGFPARAAATFGAFTDFEAMIAEEKQSAMARQIIPGFEENRSAAITRRSAVAWSDTLTVPLLLLHGGSDRSVKPEQALRLAMQLDRAGARYGLVVFEGDNHRISQNATERDRMITAWFLRHLDGDD